MNETGGDILHAVQTFCNKKPKNMNVTQCFSPHPNYISSSCGLNACQLARMKGVISGKANTKDAENSHKRLEREFKIF